MAWPAEFKTPQKVLQHAEVKTVRCTCLSLPLDYPGGATVTAPPSTGAEATMRGDKPNMNYPLRCDDPTATDTSAMTRWY